MVPVVRRLGERRGPGGRGTAVLDDLPGGVAPGEDRVILRRYDKGLEVEGIGPEEDAVKVAMGDADGAAAGGVEAHRFERVVGRFDGLSDMKAALAARRVGESLDPFEGQPAGPDEGVGRALVAGELGQ